MTTLKVPLVTKRLRIFDAWGQEISRVIECHIETGRFIQLAVDANGTLLRSEDGGSIVKVEGVAAAPLRVEEIDEG